MPALPGGSERRAHRPGLLRRGLLSRHHIPFLILALWTAGCASPSPEFADARREQIERDGHRYALYLLAARAQAIRLTAARPGTHGPIMETMSALVAEATGCRPIPVGRTADSGVITFRLDCPRSVASG